jgi:hypothetical protein
MSHKIIKWKDYKDIRVNTICLKSPSMTSKTKKVFTMDVYFLENCKRCPLLVQTPVLSIGSNIFLRNNYSYFFISLRNLEYDKEIQDFYRLVTNIEYSIIQNLLNLYELSENYNNTMILDITEQTKADILDYNFVINTQKYVSISVEHKNDITTIYDRFKHQIGIDNIVKNNRGQFILELPQIWFELDDNDKIIKIGFNWNALQIKLIQQYSIQECLIEDEKPEINIPPPPPPPPPSFMVGGLKRIGAVDLLAGIGGLKRATIDNDKPIKKAFKPPQNGFKPPSLDDILSRLKNLKRKE